MHIQGRQGTLCFDRGFFNLDNMAFTTKDKDNDGGSDVNCAVLYTGAWRYNACHNSNLNGNYHGREKNDYKRVVWATFRDGLSLKFTKMKVKPSS